MSALCLSISCHTNSALTFYAPIGTAFAIAMAPNRYVTAGHVIAAGISSQYRPPALRAATGKVYPIDQVLEYSQHEDFVVSLRQGSAVSEGRLQTGAQ